MKIMFWNTHKSHNINQTIVDIVQEKSVDIIALAEYSDDINVLCSTLNMNPYLTIGCNRIIVLGTKKNVEPGEQTDHYSFQIIEGKYIICIMHLPSKLHSSEGDRRIIIQQLIKELEAQEVNLCSENSILVGDINEDPYESGCIAADQFHGIPCYDDALKATRLVQRKPCKMFYNPMWNFFGDFDKPPGTYYYSNGNAECSYWHIFDQVMIRPCLRQQFAEQSLEIVTHTHNAVLINRKGHPDKKYSDHFPIVFEIKEEAL